MDVIASPVPRPVWTRACDVGLSWPLSRPSPRPKVLLGSVPPLRRWHGPVAALLTLRALRRRVAALVPLLAPVSTGAEMEMVELGEKVAPEDRQLGMVWDGKDWRSFPSDFLWGVATAAFQVEGAVTEGGISAEGLAFYEDLCREALANGILEDAMDDRRIEPVATLYHWDLPEALEQEGGWLKRETVEVFADYAALCFQRLGKYVKTWCSLNEPWTQCILGYCFGSHAPGRSVAPGEEPYLAGHHMLLAHGRAAEIYRKVRPEGGKIAMVLNTEWAEPQEPNNIEDQAAVERALSFNLDWFAAPLYEGDYPQLMRQRVGQRLPRFTETERKLAIPSNDGQLLGLFVKEPRGSNDFFALNCYSARYICEDNFWRNLQNTPAKLRTGENPIEQILPFVSEVLVQKLKVALSADAAAADTAEVPVVAAGGPATPSPETLPTTSWTKDAGGSGVKWRDSESAGPRQATYLQRQSVVLRRAMLEGADVRGYIWWTLMDNFEWRYSKHFGLYAVDFPGLARTPRAVAATYQRLSGSNAVDGDAMPDAIDGRPFDHFSFSSEPEVALKRAQDLDWGNAMMGLLEHACWSTAKTFLKASTQPFGSVAIELKEDSLANL
eukprot:s865_g18.t1